MRQINESLRYESSQTIPRPMQNPGSEESSDQTYGGGTVNNYRDSSVPSRTIEDDQSAGPCQRRRCLIVTRTDTSADIVKSHEDEMKI